ncbi:hypothetical protein AB6A40_011058 [Gnathostoma spinigerum]|uniref:Uncharacterized protein n=1 Tax=Gnathostoma spinigerum TaxID=75299 RepID=A0ABD6F2R0_9BILA
MPKESVKAVQSPKAAPPVDEKRSSMREKRSKVDGSFRRRKDNSESAGYIDSCPDTTPEELIEFRKTAWI